MGEPPSPLKGVVASAPLHQGQLPLKIMLVSWLQLAGSLASRWLLMDNEIKGLIDEGGNTPFPLVSLRSENGLFKVKLRDRNPLLILS
ncbi:MAG: hypothetical protein GY696_18160 [Gammaproteobacteria bacterium]|nr:hypothetical protein [Gammaproteobacteria bacterium]